LTAKCVVCGALVVSAIPANNRTKNVRQQNIANHNRVGKMPCSCRQPSRNMPIKRNLTPPKLAGVHSVLNTDYANKVLHPTQAMIGYVAQTDEHPKTVYIE